MAESGSSKKWKNGQISLFLGGQFAKKTDTLLSHVEAAAYAGYKGVIVKHAQDERYDPELVVKTHAGRQIQTTSGSSEIAAIRVVKESRLADVELEPDETVIGVDEGQFFPDLAEVCDRWADKGMNVAVAALDGTFERKPWPQIAAITPKAENITKLHSVCMRCRDEPGSFTSRLGEETDLVVIGGTDKYLAGCRKCWNTLEIEREARLSAHATFTPD